MSRRVPSTSSTLPIKQQDKGKAPSAHLTLLKDPKRDEKRDELVAEVVLKRAEDVPLRFLSGSVEDFREKVEAVCEPGNRTHYAAPCFCYLQSRKTGKTRMLLAKKRGIFNLYIACGTFGHGNRVRSTTDSIYTQMRDWMVDKTAEECAGMMAEMVIAFLDYMTERKLHSGGYRAEEVFPDGLSALIGPPTANSSSSASYSHRKHGRTAMSMVEHVRGLRLSSTKEAARIVLSFDDAGCMLRDIVRVRGGARVNMLRWVRHCLGTGSDFFWNCPAVFVDSSPEIDKADPRRHGEAASLQDFEGNGEESNADKRLFMPLILHDAFDLFLDAPQMTSVEVTTRGSWVQHLHSTRYLLEMAHHGRPFWGALTEALLATVSDRSQHARLFVRAVYRQAEGLFPGGKAILEAIEGKGKAGAVPQPPPYVFEAAVVLLIASTMAVFEIHSTNLNLLYAKRHLCELLALDIDGRVCFATFPSEPLVACQSADLVDRFAAVVLREAVNLCREGTFSFDSTDVFILQQTLLLAALRAEPSTGECEWGEAVSGTPLRHCLPRRTGHVLGWLVGVGQHSLSALGSSAANLLSSGITAFCHFATVDMEDNGGGGGCNSAIQLQAQLSVTVARLLQRSAAGLIVDRWRGIDLIVPCVADRPDGTRQLSAVLIAVEEAGSMTGEEHPIDDVLAELSSASSSDQFPCIGVVWHPRGGTGGSHSSSLKKVGSSTRITLHGLSYPPLSTFMSEEEFAILEEVLMDPPHEPLSSSPNPAALPHSQHSEQCLCGQKH